MTPTTPITFFMLPPGRLLKHSTNERTVIFETDRKIWQKMLYSCVDTPELENRVDLGLSHRALEIHHQLQRDRGEYAVGNGHHNRDKKQFQNLLDK